LQLFLTQRINRGRVGGVEISLEGIEVISFYQHPFGFICRLFSYS